MDFPLNLMIVILAIARTLVAATMTVHVLLRKRDVRAALGWIGVAWLSPIVGSLLYFLFGINRVARRARHFGRLGRPLHDAGDSPSKPGVAPNIATLSDIGLAATHQSLLSGATATVFRGGDEAYSAMLAAIQSARHSIALASYIFRNDAVGYPFVEALIAAHRRGVAVRVLLDGVGCGYFWPTILRRLRAGGVPVGRFLHTWVPWRMPFLNMRNHKKLLIIDGAIGFTGGLNIWALGDRRLSLRRYAEDVHVCMVGPVVRQFMETFAEDWSFTMNEQLEQDIWWPDLKSKGSVFARGIRSGPDADLDVMETVLGAALAQAQQRVRIVTPYFLPDQRLQFAIAQARLRGVTVDVVLPEKTDLFFMDWAMRAHLRFLGNPLPDIYLSGPDFDHSKIVTVDSAFCLFGSSNWDARSLRLNFEFDVECYDADLVARFDAIIDTTIARGRRLEWKELAATPVWLRLRDAATRLLLPYL